MTKLKQLALLASSTDVNELEQMLEESVIFGPITSEITRLSDSTFYVLLSAEVTEQSVASVAKTFKEFQKSFEETKTTTVTWEQIKNFGKSDSDPTKKNWPIPAKEFEPKSKFLVQIL